MAEDSHEAIDAGQQATEARDSSLDIDAHETRSHAGF